MAMKKKQKSKQKMKARIQMKQMKILVDRMIWNFLIRKIFHLKKARQLFPNTLLHHLYYPEMNSFSCWMQGLKRFVSWNLLIFHFWWLLKETSSMPLFPGSGCDLSDSYGNILKSLRYHILNCFFITFYLRFFEQKIYI